MDMSSIKMSPNSRSHFVRRFTHSWSIWYRVQWWIGGVLCQTSCSCVIRGSVCLMVGSDNTWPFTVEAVPPVVCACIQMMMWYIAAHTANLVPHIEDTWKLVGWVRPKSHTAQLVPQMTTTCMSRLGKAEISNPKTDVSNLTLPKTVISNPKAEVSNPTLPYLFLKQHIQVGWVKPRFQIPWCLASSPKDGSRWVRLRILHLYCHWVYW